MWWNRFRRQQVLAEAAAEQQHEHEEAVRRLLEASAWNRPTEALIIRPLMTRGQEWRTRR